MAQLTRGAFTINDFLQNQPFSELIGFGSRDESQFQKAKNWICDVNFIRELICLGHFFII